MSLYILQYNTWQNYKLRLGRAPMFFMVVVDSHPFAISFIYHLTWICSVRVYLPHNILLEWIRSCWIIFSGAMMIMHWSWIDAWQRRFLFFVCWGQRSQLIVHSNTIWSTSHTVITCFPLRPSQPHPHQVLWINKPSNFLNDSCSETSWY